MLTRHRQAIIALQSSNCFLKKVRACQKCYKKPRIFQQSTENLYSIGMQTVLQATVAFQLLKNGIKKNNTKDNLITRTAVLIIPFTFKKTIKPSLQFLI